MTVTTNDSPLGSDVPVGAIVTYDVPPLVHVSLSISGAPLISLTVKLCGDAVGAAKVRNAVVAVIVFWPGGSVGAGVGEPPGDGETVGVGDGVGLVVTVALSAKMTYAGVAAIVNGVVPAANVSVLLLSVPVPIVTNPAPLSVEVYCSRVYTAPLTISLEGSTNEKPGVPANVTVSLDCTSTYSRIDDETVCADRWAEAPLTPSGAVLDAVSVRVDPTPALAPGKVTPVEVVPPPPSDAEVPVDPTVAVVTSPGVGAAGVWTIAEPLLQAASRAAKATMQAGR